MKKEMLSSKIFDSRIKSANIQMSERILGYLLAPAFVMSMFYISGQSYLNMFYTDVLKLTPVAGGMFLALLPVVSKILDAITNTKISLNNNLDKEETRKEIESINDEFENKFFPYSYNPNNPIDNYLETASTSKKR